MPPQRTPALLLCAESNSNPISGYRTDDPDIRLISQSNEIEVWLVSLPKTDMYVPYRIVLPTVSGYASATSSLLKSQTDAIPLRCVFDLSGTK